MKASWVNARASVDDPIKVGSGVLLRHPGRLSAWSATGNEEWTVPDELFVGAVLRCGSVLITSDGSTATSYARATGERLWQQGCTRPPHVGADGHLYLGQQTDTPGLMLLERTDPATGRMIEDGVCMDGPNVVDASGAVWSTVPGGHHDVGLAPGTWRSTRLGSSTERLDPVGRFDLVASVQRIVGRRMVAGPPSTMTVVDVFDLSGALLASIPACLGGGMAVHHERVARTVHGRLRVTQVHDDGTISEHLDVPLKSEVAATILLDRDRVVWQDGGGVRCSAPGLSPTTRVDGRLCGMHGGRILVATADEMMVFDLGTPC